MLCFALCVMWFANQDSYTAIIKIKYNKVLENMESLLPFSPIKNEYEELCKVSHRPYTTGFYFGKPDENSQVYTSSSYIRDYDLIGIVKSYDAENGIATITQRNRFFKVDEIEIFQPMKPFFVQTVDSMCDENGNEIEVANHAEQIVKFKTAQPVCEGAMLRKKK